MLAIFKPGHAAQVRHPRYDLVFALPLLVAPRVDSSQVKIGGTASDQTEFAFSFGLDLAFLNGLGVRAAYEWIKPSGAALSTSRVGVNHSFRRPGS